MGFFDRYSNPGFSHLCKWAFSLKIQEMGLVEQDELGGRMIAKDWNPRLKGVVETSTLARLEGGNLQD